MHRHVGTTGLIKNLVITEESGIAKGIRRIVAVTGSEAQEVSRIATALEADLVAIERKNGKEKDSAMKIFSTVRVFRLTYGGWFTFPFLLNRCLLPPIFRSFERQR